EVGVELLVRRGGVRDRRRGDRRRRAARLTVGVPGGLDAVAGDLDGDVAGLARLDLDPRPGAVRPGRQVEVLGERCLARAEDGLAVAAGGALDGDVADGV